MNNYETEGRTAKFNAGMLQAARIHKLQDQVNVCNLNPLAYNEEFKAYNYEVIISCLVSLYHESEPKLKTESRERFNKIHKVVLKSLREYPLIEMRSSISSGSKKPYTNSNYWEKYQQFLYDFENLVREFIDEAGLNNPDYDNDDADPY